MGKYFFDSLIQTFVESNPGYGINITEADMYPDTTVIMDTRHLNLYLPGIGYHYAPIPK